MKNWWEKPAYRIVMTLARLIGRISPERGFEMGKIIGHLIFKCHGRYREIALENIGNAYPENSEGENRRIAATVFENLGIIFYEVCWSTALSNKAICRQINVQGMQHIEAAYARGKGVLVLTAHFGNWELLTVVGKLVGYPLSIVYRPLDFKPLERFIVNLRGRFGATMIPKKKGFRKVLQSLDRKEMVAILMDQNVAWREGVFAPFFNRPACTNKGLAQLALKTGAPVVPIFLLREAKGYRGIVLPEIPLIRTGDKTKDVEINTAAYNDAIETMVRQYPGQWFWVHRRWNTKPFCPWPNPSSGNVKQR